MADGIDFSEMDEFTKKLMDLAVKKMPKESKAFLRKEGNKLRKLTKQKAKGIKDTNAYYKSIKRGKVYTYDGKLSIRAYSNDPKAHLIEDGHRIVGKDGSEHGFQQGHHVFKNSQREFEAEFMADCKEFFTGLLEEGLS